MKRMTFCIPTKNNLRYLKTCIQSIKDNSAVPHDIIVFVDSDADNATEWLRENNIVFLKNDMSSPRGIAYAYNRCIEKATTDIVCMFHADMYMAKGFDVGVLKHLEIGTVVAGTRIEPPLHPEGREKIVKNFGLYPEEFKQQEFDAYVQTLLKEKEGVTTNGIFAPWAIHRTDIMSIGMHDEQFHSYHEDSDIFNRFVLNGYTLVQSWEAYVYHLTCRGGQFQDGIESVTKDIAFHQMKQSSLLKYIRKWGNMIQNDEYHHPIIPPKYDIRLSLYNAKSLGHLEMVEPFVNILLVDSESLLTEFNNKYSELAGKVGLTHECNDLTKYPVDVTLNVNVASEQDIRNLHQLNSMLLELENSNETGMFEIGNITLYVNELKNSLV